MIQQLSSRGGGWQIRNPLGDVDCAGAVDAVDALKILRHVASLPVTQAPGCAHIGDPLG